MKVSAINSVGDSFCCNYATDTFDGNYAGDVCCIYAGFKVVLSVTVMLVDLSDASDCFCSNYAVRGFCSTYAGESFCSKLVGDKFYCNYAYWAFFYHFWSFLLDGDFLQKICLCHRQLYLEPRHHAKFQKKTNEPIQRKLTDRQKDGRKDGWEDGQTLFYRTLPAIFKKNVLTDSSNLFKKGMQFLSKKRNYKTFARLFLHCYFMYLIVYYSIYKQYSPT